MNAPNPNPCPVTALRANYPTLRRVAESHPEAFPAGPPRTWKADAAALAAFIDAAADPRPARTPDIVREAVSSLVVNMPRKGDAVPRSVAATIGAVMGRRIEHDAPHAIIDGDGYCPRHGGSFRWEPATDETPAGWAARPAARGPAAAIRSAVNAGAALSGIAHDPEHAMCSGIVRTFLSWGVPADVLAAAITDAADRLRMDGEGSRTMSRAGRKAAAQRRRVRVALDRVEDRTADAAQAVAGAMDEGADRESITDREARGAIRGKARAGHVRVRKAAKAADAAAGTAGKAARRAAAADAAAGYARAAVKAARAAIAG
jgi:hypothetical protein